MILSFLSGTATLAAFFAVLRLRNRDHFWLLVVLAGGGAWLVGMLFWPELHSYEWHVYHECALALLLTPFGIRGVKRDDLRLVLEFICVVAVLGLAVSLISVEGEPHAAYRGLICLDVALLSLLLNGVQSQDHVTRTASAFLALAIGVNAVHHFAWEINVALAMFVGRFASVLYLVAMLMIARAALKGLPDWLRPRVAAAVSWLRRGLGLPWRSRLTSQRFPPTAQVPPSIPSRRA
jgi:hypothetical protein